MRPKQEEWEKELWKKTKDFLDSLHPDTRFAFTAHLFVMFHLAEDNKGKMAKAMKEEMKPVRNWLEKINRVVTAETRKKMKVRKQKYNLKEGGIQWH